MHCSMGTSWSEKLPVRPPPIPPYSVLYGAWLHGNHVTFPHSKIEGEEEETGEGDQWRYKDIFDNEG